MDQDRLTYWNTKLFVLSHTMNLVLNLALLNFIRGRGLFPYAKWVTAILSGLAVGIHFWSPYYGLITFIGIRFWSMWGWGSYFCAFTGEDNRTIREIWWIDDIGRRLLPQGTPFYNRLRGTLQMSLRGLFLYPMFIMLGAPLVGLGVLLQGPCYGVMTWLPQNGKYGVMAAEALFGAVIGLLILATQWGAQWSL